MNASKFFWVIIFGSLLVLSSARAQEKNDIYRWVNYQELSDYNAADFPLQLQNDLANSLKQQGINDFQSFRFEERMQPSADGNLIASITVIAGADAAHRLFIKGSLMATADMKFVDFHQDQVIPIAAVRFSVQVGIMQLKALLTDEEHGIHILYPISGPGFDEGFSPRSQGHTIFLHPIIHGVLDRSKAMAHRTDPHYYKNRPFIRIIPDGQAWSLFGFHTSPWTDHLERGFVSAGCMRLKDNDLQELYEIVRYGGDPKISTQVKYELSESDDHPYPKMTDQYEHVVRSHPKDGRMVFNTGRIFLKKDKNAPTIEHLLNQIYRYEGFWPDNSGMSSGVRGSGDTADRVNQ